MSGADPILARLDHLLPDLEALYKHVHANPEALKLFDNLAGP